MARSAHFDRYISLSEAAKETGKSKSTIFKALKNGDMSYVDKTDAGYKIDPAELFRAFPKKTKNDFENREREQTQTGATSPANVSEAMKAALWQERVGALEKHVALLEDRLREKDAIIADLKEERGDWKRQAERLLLERPAGQEKRKWFGRKSPASS